MMHEPSFDRDGYPTDETLKAIETWDITQAVALPHYLASSWNTTYGKVEEVRPGLWTFATGGWSGNESLLAAMRQSVAWGLLHWDSLYLPGGLQVIAVSDAAKQEMDRLHGKITEWAWAKKSIPIVPTNQEYPIKTEPTE